MTALVTMSRRELDRASVLAQLAEGRVSQVQAAELLGLGVRQVRRLSRAYAACGPAALASNIRAGDVELPARAFPKEARAGVTPGDIVADKHLGAVLSVIRAQQLEREEERLKKARTDRERRLLKKRLKSVARG